MPTSTTNSGSFGEVEAIKYLQGAGYKITRTNYHTKFGEIDIICEFNGKVVFFEVKYRKGDKNGTPEEALTKSKKRRILKSIEQYCMIYKIDFDYVTFDLIAIKDSNNIVNISHHINISLLD